jgi:predicted transcriptional regulator
MSIEERVLHLEKYFTMLVELARSSNERMDEFDSKLNALAEAQTRTEANLSALTSIVGDTEKRLDRLAEIVERHIVEGHNGQS